MLAERILWFYNVMAEHILFLPVASVVIYIFFKLLKRGDRRTSWYFSLSAPGSILLPGSLWITYRSGTYVSSWGLLIILHFVTFPAFFIFPVVSIIQSVKIIKGKTETMEKKSYIWCGVLLFLYFWTELIYRSFV
jgi:hypothetical protein